MKRLYFVSVFLSVCLILFSQNREKLLIGGCGWNKIAIIDKATKAIEWEHVFLHREDCNDLQLTSDGNILYAYNRGARLVNMNHEVIWDFQVNKGEELFTVRQLKNGRYLLAMCGHPARIVELNKKGKVVKSKEFDTGIKSVHGQFRQITVKEDGGYIIPLMGKGEVIETDKKMKIIRRVKCGGNPFSVFVTKEGKWMVSCGDGHKLVYINPDDGQITDTIDSSSFGGLSMNFVAEAFVYDNGNTLFCNWNGHTKDKSQPLLVEFDSNKKIVWTLYPSDDIVNISAVFSFYDSNLTLK